MTQNTLSQDQPVGGLQRVHPRPQSAGSFLARHWLGIFLTVYGIFVGLPFLAPVFKYLGLDPLANVIYTFFSFLCHQLPERSYFLFGQKFTYSLAEIQAAWKNTANPMILRQFIGNPAMGWKVAWSDRMVSMYTGLWLAAAFFGALRSRFRPIGWRGLVLLSLPMAVDGLTHLVSDLAGIGQGFRDTNLWLAALTGNIFPSAFYAGDAWGSFNSILRLLTGLLFAVGVVWFSFQYIDLSFGEKDQLIGGNDNGY